MKINIDLIYPIGAVYISTNTINPSTLFGGEWRQIKDTFLLACGDKYSNEAIGGSATHTHDFSHTHGVPGVKHRHDLSTGYAELYSGSSNIVLNQKTIEKNVSFRQWTGGAWVTHDPYTSNTALTLGGNSGETTPSATTTNSQSQSVSSEISNMPPYLAVCVWERIG